jgi:carboxyl-terminal processing protease
MVILVNASTASSGEIITSALKFYGRGIVLGDRTFGKAIGQIQEDYSKDRVALLFTSLKAHLPDGTSYHGKGVSPDVYVYQHGMKPSARELETLREEDLALFSLKIEESKFYEKAQVGVKFPSACVKEENVKKNMSLIADTHWEKDFQLQFGLETLHCLK